MGFFSQSSKKSIGFSTRPGPPKLMDELYDRNDASPRHVPKVKDNELFSLDDEGYKNHHLTQRYWNILQTPRRSSSFVTSKNQLLSALESDTDRSMSPTDEWNNENDEVTLLPQRLPQRKTFDKEPTVNCKDVNEEESDLASTPSSLRKAVLPSAPALNNGSRSQNLWNRISSFKSVKNQSNQGPSVDYTKKSRLRNETEIQFECFFEDDECSFDVGKRFTSSSSSSSPTPSPTITKNSAVPALFRRTTVMQSWVTHTIGTVKRGRRIPGRHQHDKKSAETTGAKLAIFTDNCDDDDDDEMSQIIFDSKCCNEKTQVSTTTSGEIVLNTFGHNPLWGTEAPIQFYIPDDDDVDDNSSFSSSLSCDYHYDAWQYRNGNDTSTDNGLTSVIVPIV
jgi:hypothetical protein